MKKWAESRERIVLLTDLNKISNLEDIIQINDNECNGTIFRTSYHDGSLVFTTLLFKSIIRELKDTETKEIGTIKLITDFVVCNMKFLKNTNVQRDTIIVKFKFR